MTEQVANIATLKVKIEINAAPEEVWKGLTEDIGKWWPAEFYTGGDASSRNMEVELTPGGRMFESWDTGGGTLWGNVISFEPNKLLHILGHQFPNWGGPSQWYGTWSLERAGNKTSLSYSEATLGKISADGIEQKDSGWMFLFKCLQAFVENKPAPSWPA